MTGTQRFASVRDARENTPQEAALFGVTQPRMSDLMRGKINLFSLDTLIDRAATAGMAPIVKVSMPKASPAKGVPGRALPHA